MTDRPQCQGCKRPLKHPSPTGYGPKCARKHGITSTRRARTTAKARRPKPVTDALPGQTELPLVYFEATLWSL